MKPEKRNELVLVFKDELLYGFTGLLSDQYPKVLNLQGLSTEYSDCLWLENCLPHSFFLPRGIVENDPSYKQIIPYIVLKNKGRYFSYSRDGAETRLKGSLSVGIGGHINPVDWGGDLTKALRNAAQREFAEEVSIPHTYSMERRWRLDLSGRPKAVLYAGGSGDDMVNRVHFGVVYTVYISDDVVDEVDLQEEGKFVGWSTKSELEDCWDELETWSKLVVQECL